jgi:hypothetical protein
MWLWLDISCHSPHPTTPFKNALRHFARRGRYVPFVVFFGHDGFPVPKPQFYSTFPAT